MCWPAPIAASARGSAIPRSAGPSSRQWPKGRGARPGPYGGGLKPSLTLGIAADRCEAGPPLPTSGGYSRWGAMHEPQPYAGYDGDGYAGEHVDPGHGRMAGEPDDPRRYGHPDTEYEADPFLPLGKRRKRGDRDGGDCYAAQPSIPARRSFGYKAEDPWRQK